MQSTADSSDAIIVGGGPVGSYAALRLAKLGVKVTVFEEHPAIGLPSHCAGHISIHSLKAMGLYPLPNGIVENTFDAANFYSSTGTKFSLKLSSSVTVALNRALFDQYLAKQAQAAGAVIRLNSYVQSLIMQDGFVKSVNIQSGKNARAVSAKITIDAEGISSRLLRQTGLTPLKPKGLVYAVEAEVDEAKDVEPHAVEVYLGKAYASGFYGWLIPRLDGTAKIGLATNKGNPREHLQRLMTKHPVASKQLANAKITKISFHSITLGGPIQRAYANGFLAVGDVASQVKPTTGGGVIFGLTCAKIAAEVVNDALEKGDVSSDFLEFYQKRCD
ncbi:NAD(P)/FAD-dependent oxidoreductase, partial [Candidatus Bathyarchaeota archaeon]|nr:NAD(P)/FAD-dependent oxidoreductase [Candidatus Bathyarchaeota archaeon]